MKYVIFLARQLETWYCFKEFSKIDAIMGEEIEETGDFVVDEKDKVVNLTEQGVKKVEDTSTSITWLIRKIWRSSTTSSCHCAQTT